MSYKILLVDDDQDLVEMLCRYFRLKGYEMLTAVNGLDAVKKSGEGPDLILLDINMPGMDGLEVCRRIRDQVSCPILFLTARVEEQDRVNGLMMGGDDYIVKPFSLKELEARVLAHLRREERHQQFDHMKEELAQNNQKMWRMVEDEQVLRSAIAHDLRTPLTVLKGYQEMMMEFIPEEKLDREALLDMLKESMGQVERLERFLDRMRAFSALEREPISCMDTTAAEIAEQIEKTGEMLAAASGKQFEIFAGGEGEKLTLDRDLILEVAENLITNALRYAASKVSVVVCREADRLVLEVKDDGTGFTISEEEAKQAFTSANPRDDLKHFGLGMYISEVFCKKHGGHLEVENQRDGACVRAYFRLCTDVK